MYVCGFFAAVQHPHCDSCIQRNCTAITNPPCAIISCSVFCGAVFHECKTSEHRQLCPLEEVPCINVENGCPMVLRRCDLWQHLSMCPANVISCNDIRCPMEIHIREPSLDSFICAQLFRRDEYTQHVRDVHAVIHDAIDHWLEVRCPLAHCGCTFSMHRRQPSGADIIFSPLLEPTANICIRPRTSKELTLREDSDMMCLTGLPVELLVRVATFLDSFSICSLSLTCWLLRDVCHSLVKQRGLVVDEWQRDCSGTSPRWKVSHQVSLSFNLSMCCCYE